MLVLKIRLEDLRGRKVLPVMSRKVLDYSNFDYFPLHNS